jgi:hypothetical protein
MATYLQLPVLRITKYHLLLQRYLKLLEKDSFSYNQVLEALNLMKQVNDEINKNMPDFFDNNSSTKMSTNSKNKNSMNSNDHVEVMYNKSDSINNNKNNFNLFNLYGNILKEVK